MCVCGVPAIAGGPERGMANVVARRPVWVPLHARARLMMACVLCVVDRERITKRRPGFCCCCVCVPPRALLRKGQGPGAAAVVLLCTLAF